MLGLKNTTNQRFNATVFNAKKSGIQALGSNSNRSSFSGKRKRSMDATVSDSQPRKQKQRRTSPEFVVNESLEIPSSFVQPLAPFETSTKINPITEFKHTHAIMQLPTNKGGHVLLNRSIGGKPVRTFGQTIPPAVGLCKANATIGNLNKRIRRLEEQNQYWRRKSLTLGNENVLLRQELDKMKIAVTRVENERLALQTKLMRAESSNHSCVMEIRTLMAANKDLKGAVEDLNEELAMLSTVDAPPATNVEMTGLSVENVEQIEEALADTLADLTDKIGEIEELKKALATVSVEKSQLDEVVTRQTILSEMLGMDEADDQKDSEVSPQLAKIGRLQGAVEKCMFRIAHLSEKNEEFKAVIREARQANRVPSAPETSSVLLSLEDGQKVQILESLCMQRYRSLLREAAESLVGHDVTSSSGMDESF